MGNNQHGEKNGKLHSVATEACVLSCEEGRQNNKIILIETSRKLKVVKKQ